MSYKNLKVKFYGKPNGKWQFQLWSGNNEALMTSQEYDTRSDMMAAIFLVQNVKVHEEATPTETPDHETI